MKCFSHKNSESKHNCFQSFFIFIIFKGWQFCTTRMDFNESNAEIGLKLHCRCISNKCLVHLFTHFKRIFNAQMFFVIWAIFPISNARFLSDGPYETEIFRVFGCNCWPSREQMFIVYCLSFTRTCLDFFKTGYTLEYSIWFKTKQKNLI